MESIWSQTCQIEKREPLHGDMKADAAVIGAGIAGILIADALKEAGLQVAVLVVCAMLMPNLMPLLKAGAALLAVRWLARLALPESVAVLFASR